MFWYVDFDFTNKITKQPFWWNFFKRNFWHEGSKLCVFRGQIWNQDTSKYVLTDFGMIWRYLLLPIGGLCALDNWWNVELDQVWISLDSSLIASKPTGLSFSGHKILASYSNFRVYGFERKFWPRFGQNASFYGKIFYCSEMDLTEFQFLGFFSSSGFGNL